MRSKNRLKIMIALSPLALALGSAEAAQRVDLHQQNMAQLNTQNLAAIAKFGQPSMVQNRHEQFLGMDSESKLILLKRTVAKNGAQNYRYQQTFRGIPIFGTHVIVSEDHNGNVRTLFGQQINDLASDLTLASSKPKLTQAQALAIGKRAGLVTNVTMTRTQNEQTRQMIYVDDNSRAHMSYVVSYFADTIKGGTPKRPFVIIDADTGKIFKQWDGLTTDLIGTGPGGNNKTGQYEYGTDFGFNDVSVSGANCTMNNTNVKSVDLHGGTSGNTAFVYTCPRNTYKAINGAFSPINDAHYFGSIVFSMYNDYVGGPPLTFQLAMKVHYSNKYENAFWDGSSMTFGDGFNTFYPLVSLDVSAHEVSHGYTEQNSGLIYDNQSGGMNEAYSDMAGEAAEFFNNGDNDFEVGAEIFKAPGQALRYMYDPPLDGISIANFSQYNNNIDVHYTSGIYNKAFYLLATTPGWTTETAFQAFAFANRDYWVPNETMQNGDCGVETAATDMGKSAADVAAAFLAVGLDCPGSTTTTYSNNTDYAIPDNNGKKAKSLISVTGRVGNALSNTQVHVKVVHPTSGQLKVTLVAPDTTNYVLQNKVGGSTDNIDQTYTVNLSSEAMNGTWKLRVEDKTTGDVGFIDSWTITF